MRGTIVRAPSAAGPSPVRLISYGSLAATIVWMLVIMSRGDSEGEEGMHDSGHAVPAPREGRVTGAVVDAGPLVRPRRSPGPVIKPSQRPPFRMYLHETYNLRGCECRKDWAEMPEDAPSKCQCNGGCPAFVDPPFLTAGAGQGLCNLEADTGYNCHAECPSETDKNIRWFASPCGGPGHVACDPRIKGATLGGGPGGSAPGAGAAAAAPSPSAPPTPSPSAKPKSNLPWNPDDVFDLRGLNCELLDGKERCFYEDGQGRELCPEHVTHEYLSNPKDQYLCQPAQAEKYYCIVGCQSGNPDVKWGANEVAWCSDPKNAGACTPRSSPVPKAQFTLKPWSEKVPPPSACEAAALRGDKPRKVEGVSVGMLTHEPRSMADSLATYEANGFFDLVPEFMIYINKRRPEIDAAIEPYLKRHANIRVLGDETNYGILRAMVMLTGNASHPYFLFLERDFQLVSPATCVSEQLEAGVAMLKMKKADVVRYRHRVRAGRPNWAERMYRGKEDAVFKSAQPNLFCNHHYWVPEGEKRWPDKMWKCFDNPPMICSDSYYCNWTNNPQMWSVDWWNREYVEGSLKKNNRIDPYADVEYWMNWDFDAWNNRKFTVAQGEGLFKHVDRTGNFGIG